MNTWDKCKNCGGEHGLHHYQTDQCPVGGREASVGRLQEWKTTTFELDTQPIEEKNAEIKALRKFRDDVIRYLEAGGITTLEDRRFVIEQAEKTRRS